MAYALVFSGQGLQHEHMLPWLADDALVHTLQARLHTINWRASLQDLDWATRNSNAQCFLTGLSLAAWTQLAPLLPPPTAIAGYSVGELAAFSAAGVFDELTALDLASQRAAAMDECAAQTPGALLGVSRIAPAMLERLLAGAPAITVAIRNAPDSVVLGGPPLALTRVDAQATAEGAHCTPLRVAVASHTPAMGPAATAFQKALDRVHLHRPHTSLFSNVADRIFTADQAQAALAAQIANTVRWDECMENLNARGVGCVLEIGAGQALARLWNQRYPNVPARAADEFRSVEALAHWIQQHVEQR